MHVSNHLRPGRATTRGPGAPVRILGVLVTASMVALAFPAGAEARPGAPVRCGDTITVDTRLVADLIGCPGLGLVIGADNITLDLNGHTVAGNGIADFEGIQSIGHSGVTIENGSIQRFVEGVAVIRASHVLLRNLRLSDHRHVGAFVAESSDVRIENSTASAIAASGFFVAVSHDIQIEHNAVSRSGGGIAARASERIHIAHNTASQNTGEGVALFDDADHSVVEMNTVGTSESDGIVVTSGSDHNVVRQNSVSGTLGGVGIAGADENLVVGNVLRSNRFVGLYVYGGDDNRIDGNTITDNGDGTEGGIHLLTDDTGNTSDGNEVSGNMLVRNVGDGLLVDARQQHTVVEGNLAMRNTDDGIDVDSRSTTVTSNTASGNGDLGIEARRGVVDGGGNRAAGNGNPAQCTGVSCT